MFDILKSFSTRPAPHCRYTAPDLWTRPHIAAQMLQYHLDGSHDLASRSSSRIEAFVQMLDDRFHLSGKTVCDLGCGPGLYAAHLAQRGAKVTGFDISASSIAHAKSSTQDLENAPVFLTGNYLENPIPEDQDLMLLIYADYCALSPSQRASLLAKMAASLRPGGHILFDVFSDKMADGHENSILIEPDLMGGFWAASPYVGLQRRWIYEGMDLELDHYLIATQDETFEIFNWMQYFTPDHLAAELADFGFASFDLVDLENGEPLGKEYRSEFGVVIDV